MTVPLKSQAKHKAVFLDRDGTINREREYLYLIEDFEFLPGAVNGLKLLSDNEFLLIIITNQSGIARGYYNEKDVEILHDHIKTRLAEKNIILTIHPELLNFLNEKELIKTAKSYKGSLEIKTDDRMHLNQYTFFSKKEEKILE